MGKILFFDIDGTLVSFDGAMSESTKTALWAAKAAGHKIFLCSGRPRCMLNDYLLDFGFDGMICSTGAYIEYEGQVVYHRLINRAGLIRMVDFFEKNGILYNMQCEKRTVYTADNLEAITKSQQQRMAISEERLEEFMSTAVVEEESRELDDVEKAMYYESSLPVAVVQQAFAPEFTVMATSFERLNETSGEVTLAGITKSHGMEKLLQYLNMNQEDSIAFGDGENDLDMLAYAGIGVAMGNAAPHVKAVADYVTTSVDDDGILHALKHLQLI